jgi:hypothetical protein
MTPEGQANLKGQAGLGCKRNGLLLEGQVGLHIALMIRLGPPPARIQGEHTRINLKLRGYERDNLVGDRLEVVRDKSEIPEDTQLKGIAQAILGVSLPPGFPLIIVR